MDLNFHFLQRHELGYNSPYYQSVRLQRLSAWTSDKAGYIYTLYINVFLPQGDNILLSAKQKKIPNTEVYNVTISKAKTERGFVVVVVGFVLNCTPACFYLAEYNPG